MKIKENIEIGNTGYTLYDLLNKQDKGIILWTNPDPTSNFAAQAITLNSGDYDVLEIFYYSSTNTSNSASEKMIAGKNTVLRWWDAARNANYERGLNYISSNQLSFGACTIYNVGYFNNVLIPYKIIGYKTGLFS